MGCEGCGTKAGNPAGCGNNGYCSSGGCSRMEVYDWLSDVAAVPGEIHDMFEVSFKNGARKEFFRNKKQEEEIVTGDYVLVESSSVGYDVGRVSLSGELVKLQMRKKNRNRRGRSNEIRDIIRKARGKEIEKLSEARAREKQTMLRARVMARDLGLDMKLGDVEYQADLRKATFYYTADGRVDFRELIKVLAREFHVKIEMRQIGSRQEAGRVGGIGACGRELCCSTWLTDFQSVNTSAARYQNLAINQTKLSGQCGRLKCCLNYELDTYLEALREFPDEQEARRIRTKQGEAFLMKTDILKGTMTYQFKESSTFYSLTIDDVKEIVAMNARGEAPEDLEELALMEEEKEVHEFEDVVGQISLSELQQGGRKKKKRRNNRNRGNQKQGAKAEKRSDGQQKGKGSGKRSNRGRGRNRKRGPKPGGGA